MEETKREMGDKLIKTGKKLDALHANYTNIKSELEKEQSENIELQKHIDCLVREGLIQMFHSSLL